MITTGMLWLLSFNTALVIGLVVLLGYTARLVKRIVLDHEERLTTVESRVGVRGRR